MKIKFNAKIISLLDMEKFQAKFLRRSLEFTGKKIEFDWSEVQFIDLPQLCQVYMWAFQLLRKKNIVVFNFLSSDGDYASNIYHLCISYGIFSTLSAFGEKFVLQPSSSAVLSGVVKDDPIVHLSSFAAIEAFQRFLNSLDEEKTSSSLTDLKKYRTILARTGIRDIILKELGQNVLMHSDGSPAVIAVCSKTSSHLGYKGNPIPVRNYSKKLSAKEYIQVVVADFGIGIVEKLRNVFENDQAAADVLSKEHDNSIIDYAFWKETTSRQTRAIEEMLDDSKLDQEFVPPTGLYFVKQLVINLRGFIYVRSGKTIFALDCANGFDRKVLIDEWQKSLNENKLEPIPGNVLVIYLPVKSEIGQAELPLNSSSSNDFLFPLASYINASEYISGGQSEKYGAISLLAKIRAEAKKQKNNTVIAVDFDLRALSTKYIYKIIIYCMYLQENSRHIAIVDAAPKVEMNVIASEINSLTHGMQHLKPLYSISVADKSGISMGRHESVGADSVKMWIQSIMLHREQTVQGILDQCFRDEKVLLPDPSKVYISGYYEIADFFKVPGISEKVINIIFKKISFSKVRIILATTSSLEKIANELAPKIGINRESIFVAKGYPIPPSAIGAVLGIDSDEEVLILCDVIVTARTLEKIASIIPRPIQIFSVVDGRSRKNFDAKNIINVEALKTLSIKTWEEKPPHWQYDEIRLVDSVSHKLIISTRTQKEPLFDSNLSWEELILINNIVRTGHFCHGQTCYTYFFNTSKLQIVYNDEIVEIIRKDIETISEKKVVPVGVVEAGEISLHSATGRVTNICFPQGNAPAEAIANALQTYFQGSLTYLPRMVTEKGSIYSTTAFGPFDKCDIAVFIDTAATTSNTIKHAMEWASEIRAELLLGYIVVNRMASEIANFVEGVDRYRGVEVKIRSLLKEYLPAFTTYECPLCTRARKIEDQLKQPILKKCTTVLKDVLQTFQRVPIHDARCDESSLTENEAQILHQQIHLRSAIELIAVAPTVLGVKTFVDKFFIAKNDLTTRYAIIGFLEREIEVLLSDVKYKQIFDRDVIETVLDLVISTVIDNSIDEQIRIKASWVASAINHQQFLQRLCASGAVKFTEELLKNFLAIILVNCGDVKTEISCNILEMLITENCDGKDEITGALREAVFYFRFIPGLRETNVKTYSEALDTLASMFEEVGYSHPTIRTKFDDSIRVVGPESLATAVGVAYLGPSGFYQVLNEKILPAMQRVLSAWPSDFISLATYMERRFLDDLTELDLTLRQSYHLYCQGKLQPHKWKALKESLDEITRRLYKNIFHPDHSELRKLLNAASTDMKNIIEDAFSKFKYEIEVNHINFNNDSEDCNIRMPVKVLEDIVSTVFSNAIRYSETGSTIIVSSTIGANDYTLSVRSISKQDHCPQFKEGHGLYNLRLTLNKYDGSLNVSKNMDNVRVSITIPR